MYMYIYLNKLSSGAWRAGVADHPWQRGPLGLARSAWPVRPGTVGLASSWLASVGWHPVGRPQLAGFSWLASGWLAPVGWFQLDGAINWLTSSWLTSNWLPPLSG